MLHNMVDLNLKNKAIMFLNKAETTISNSAIAGNGTCHEQRNNFGNDLKPNDNIIFSFYFLSNC